MFEIFIVTLVALELIAYIYRRKIAGIAGEFWVKLVLKKLPKEYLVINDVMIKSTRGTHQIDHIVVSKYGIFVIETKQYNGLLKGTDYDKNWEFYAGKRKFYIHNPVHQNWGHVQGLKEVLELEENIFIPIVCISSNATVKVKSNCVLDIWKVVDRIKSYKEEILPDYLASYDTLQKLNITDREQRKQHVANAKNIKKEAEINQKDKCPKCGGNIVIRKGKYGEFKGCSNYPKCRYTEKM